MATPPESVCADWVDAVTSTGWVTVSVSSELALCARAIVGATDKAKPARMVERSKLLIRGVVICKGDFGILVPV